MKHRFKTLVALAVLLTNASATTFGPVENFDVVNDSGKPAHGFHIRLHGLQDIDISSLFGAANRWPNMERYGAPTVTNGGTAADPWVDVVYVSTYDAANGWAAGTPSGTLAVAPMDSCWPLGAPGVYGPAYPCDHFGVSSYKPATNVEYFWMTENGPGALADTVANVPAPIWTVTPPAPQAAVQAPAVAVVVKVPPVPVPYVPANPAPLFGMAKWVKVTATGLGYNVAVEDLVAGNAAIAAANTNVQIEWQRLQEEFGVAGTGQIDLSGVQPDPGFKSVVYKFEFYDYNGTYDSEHQANQGPDTSGSPTKPSTVGNFQVAQMAGGNFDGQAPAAILPIAPLISATLPDGVAGVDYGQQTVTVTPGNANDTINVTVSGLPAGLSYNNASGAISGTPGAVGAFNVAITATDATNNTNYTANIPMNVTDPAIVFAPALPSATTSTPYSYQLAASGGDAPFTYAITGGTLPTGLSITPAGLISGQTTVAGPVSLTIVATDSVGQASAPASVSLNVIPQVVACNGQNQAITSILKFWLTTANSQVYYAPKAGTTFAPGLTFGAFATGQQVTYRGQMDPSNVFCLASTMSVQLPLTMAVPTLASGTVGTAYSATFAGPTGGWSPYAIAVSAPAGLTGSFNAAANTVTLSGTPNASGNFLVGISTVDAHNQPFSITTAALTIAPKPVVTPPASCTKPAGATTYNGIQGNATAVSGTSVTIKSVVVNVPACAAISYQGNWSGLTKAIRVGYNVQVSKGYVLNGVITATSLIVDNGL